jgi:mono/diheme cytochrome c family protein
MKTNLGVALAVAALAMTASSRAFADAAAEYKNKCAMCHGKTGAGDTIMGKNMRVRNFASAEVQGQSDAELAMIIAKGKGKMPAQENKLSKPQIEDLVRWIRTLKK